MEEKNTTRSSSFFSKEGGDLAAKEQAPRATVKSTFLYRDEHGTILYRAEYDADFQVRYLVRLGDGSWSEREPDLLVPYNLPDLYAPPRERAIYIVGDEFDAEALRSLGQVATCGVPHPNGGFFLKDWSRHFVDRLVIILESPFAWHRDTAGLAADAIIGIAKEVQVLTPDDLEVVDTPYGVAKERLYQWIVRRAFTKESFVAWAYEAVANGDGRRKAETLRHPVEAGDNRGDAWEPETDADAIKLATGWRPPPVDLLPSEMKDYLLEVSRVLSIDPGYPLLSSICTMGAAIGNSRVIALNDEWLEPAVFWGCLIAEPSTLKSPSSDKAAEPMFSLRNAFTAYNAEQMVVYEAEYEQWKIANRPGNGKQKEEKSEPLSAPAKPRERTFRIEDVTVEKIAELLDDNPKGLYFYTDELEFFFGSFNRYKSGGAGSDRSFWLKVFNARSHDVHRKGGTRSTIAVSRAAVSVYGSSQHETLSSMFTSDFFTSGLLARMLWMMPPKCKKKFVEVGIDPQVKLAYLDTFNRLFYLDNELCFDRHYRPSPVRLSSSGLDAWKSFHAEWSDRQFASYGAIGAALAKLEAYCARFALLFSLIDKVRGRQLREEVTAEHVARAYEVVRWFAHESGRVYLMLRMPQEEIDDERIVEYIRSQVDGVTPNRVFLNNPNRWKATGNARKKLDELVAAGRLKIEQVRNGERGPTSMVYKAI